MPRASAQLSNAPTNRKGLCAFASTLSPEVSTIAARTIGGRSNTVTDGGSVNRMVEGWLARSPRLSGVPLATISPRGDHRDTVGQVLCASSI